MTKRVDNPRTPGAKFGQQPKAKQEARDADRREEATGVREKVVADDHPDDDGNP